MAAISTPQYDKKCQEELEDTEEEQTPQWPKEKVQKDKQRSTKHTHRSKDRVTGTPLKTGDELICSGRVNRPCSTSGTSCVNY
jgi:hypothetical protein